MSILSNGTAVLTPAGVSLTGGSTSSNFVPLSPHFMNLLLHSSGFGNLANFYSSGILPSLASKGGLSDLISKILGLRLNVSNLTSADIKNFILNFGLFNEALLSKKQKLNPNNQKLLIGQLVRILNERGIESQNITRALLDIESSQLEANQSIQNREIFFSIIFPIKDFGNWNFSFSKKKNQKNKTDEVYTFNLHTKNDFIGEVWLRAVVEKRNNLSMQMWATKSQTYSYVPNHLVKLKNLLSDAGLNLINFELFNEERPGSKPQEKDKKVLNENIFSGSTIDIEA